MSTGREQPSLARSVIGAIVLFPAIVAGVMGLGWGLVKLAEGRAPDASGVFPDGRFSLDMHEALIRGDATLARSREWPSPYIDRWKTLKDTVEWRLHVPQAGRYQLEILYTCDADQSGGEYEVTVDGKPFTRPTVQSGIADMYLGEVTFDAPGWHTLTFQPLGVPGENLMRLSGVSFVPVR